MKINMPKKFPDHTFVWSGKLNSKDTQLSRINPEHLGGTLWIYINGSRVVHLGFNVQLWRQLSMKINMPKKFPDHTKVWSGKLNSKDTQLSHINPGHLGGTLCIYINGSREVPWGWNIQLQSQMSMNHTKVKHFSHMLNFFLHKPRTPWKHTRDIQNLFYGGTLGVTQTLLDIDEHTLLALLFLWLHNFISVVLILSVPTQNSSWMSPVSHKSAVDKCRNV